MLAVVILEMTGRHVVQTTDLARPEFPRGKKKVMLPAGIEPRVSEQQPSCAIGR